MSPHIAAALICLGLALAVTLACLPCFLRDRRQQRREQERAEFEAWEREWEDAA